MAASSYRSGQRLRDSRQGLVFFYRRRRERIRYTALVGWQGSREELWNAAEAAERRVDSVTARECVLTLFPELSTEANVAIVHSFSEWLRARHHTAIDIAIHSADVGPHAHLLFTTREVGPDGTFGARTPLDKRIGAGPREVSAMRDAWYNIANEAVQAAGFPRLLRSQQERLAYAADSLLVANAPAGPVQSPTPNMHNSQVQEAAAQLPGKNVS